MSSRYSIFHYSSTLEIFNFSQILFLSIVPFPTSRLFEWRNVHILNYYRIERNSIFLSTSIEYFQLFLLFHVSKQLYFNFHLDISFNEKKKKERKEKIRIVSIVIIYRGTENRWIFHRKRVLLLFFYARRTNYNSIFQLIEEKRVYPTDDRKID